MYLITIYNQLIILMIRTIKKVWEFQKKDNPDQTVRIGHKQFTINGRLERSINKLGG